MTAQAEAERTTREGGSASARLARWAVGVRATDLGHEAVAEARRAVLDTIGAALGGAHAEETQRLLSAVADYDGGGRGTVWGARLRLSMPVAALVNGTAAHARELDDWLALVHAGAVVVPAAYAAAEISGCSGIQFLEAVVAGYEISARVSEAAGLAAQYRHGWHPTGTCGAFGAAAAAGKALGLDEPAMTSALGIAGSFTGGIWAFIADGAMTKRLHPGKAAETGLVAALLARRGFSGPRYVLEAPFGGFLRTYVPEAHDLPKATVGLGERARILGNGYKPYACCRGVHAALDAVLAVRRREHLDAGAIASVSVRVPREVEMMCGSARIETTLDAQMSLAFSIGVALVSGRVSLADYESLPPSPEVARLMLATHVEVDDSLKDEAAIVTIERCDGRTITERVDVARGDPSVPLSDDELLEKYGELGARTLDPQAVHRSAELIMRLDREANLSALSASLTDVHRVDKART